MPLLQTPSTTPQLRKNHYQELFRLSKQPKTIGKLRFASPESDSQSMNQLCQALEQGQQNISKVLLSTGIGLSAKSEDIPLRFPALFIPGLEILKSFLEKGIDMPNYLIYQATDFIAEMNGIEAKKAQKMSQKMQSRIEQFVESFYPELQDKISIHMGLPYDAPEREQIEDLANEIRGLIKNEDRFASIAKKLAGCEKRHSQNSDNFLKYAAANVFYNGALSGRLPFEEQQEANSIIAIGGNAEKPFFQLSSHFAAREQRSLTPLLTSIGSRPTYYHYPEKQDPTSADQLNEDMSHPDGPLHLDLQALKQIGATRQRLHNIFQ